MVPEGEVLYTLKETILLFTSVVDLDPVGRNY
jgi:hypothetical protein